MKGPTSNTALFMFIAAIVAPIGIAVWLHARAKRSYKEGYADGQRIPAQQKDMTRWSFRYERGNYLRGWHDAKGKRPFTP